MVPARSNPHRILDSRTSAAVDDLSVAVAHVASLPIESLAGGDAAELVVVSARLERKLAAIRNRAAVRAEACDAYRRTGHRDAASWMASATGTGAGRTAGELEAARTLLAQPDMADVYKSGLLSGPQASAIASAIQVDPTAGPALVELVRAGRSLRAVRDQARRVRHGLADPDALHRRQRSLRTCRTWIDDDGLVAGSFRLTPEVGARLQARLQHAADRHFRKAYRAGMRERPDQYAADALAELLGVSTWSAASPPKRDTSASRTDLVVLVDLAALRRGHTNPGERCNIVGVGPVPVAVARQLADDAFLKGVLVDGTDIRKVKHFGRHIPAALRTALNLGKDLDGVRCVEPGCDRRLRLENDHVEPLANGGPTEYANLEWLCAVHHRLKTREDRMAGKLGGRGPARRHRSGTDPPTTA